MSLRGKTILLAGLALPLVIYGLLQLSNARTFQMFGRIISSVPTDDRVVALTFDDGPSAAHTEEVLSILREHKVKATFFVIGQEAAGNLQEAKRIVADGHEIGNHSFSHPRLIFKTSGSIRDEIERTDAVIRSAGFKDEIFFRPPYGKKLFILPWYLARTGRTTITWEVEPESHPEVASDAQKIADHVLERVRPGSIVLLHVMYKNREESRKALPIIIDRLREQRYKFLSVSELLRRAKA
ncbi:MAG TPA: polysaccharide deacetylase [Desulfobulbaceae bacterium]|nr:polysaccharide deacetylase [Desulfobulbaceae bacterium]